MVAGTSSEAVMAEVDIIDGNSEIPLSINAVLSNYDLLFDILLRLPVVSLVLFKSVSKHWLSLITSPRFVTSRSKIPNIDPPSALLIQRMRVNCLPSRLVYDFESFDIRIPSKKLTVFTLGSEAPRGSIEIMQSCNGLLLCCFDVTDLCVYNPTIKLFKRIPGTYCAVSSSRMAFDPTKSPHYKVIKCMAVEHSHGSSMQFHTYSSETSSWSACGDRFRIINFYGFDQGVYWNNAIHWLNRKSHITLDIANKRQILTELELPETFDRKSHVEFKLFESRGRLLLLGKDYVQLKAYEMSSDDSKWSEKYIVNLDDIMIPFPNFWITSNCVWCIVLGEREEDSFMIIDLVTKVVQYNLVSKTVRTRCDLKPICAPGMLTTFDGFQFIPSFAGV